MQDVIFTFNAIDPVAAILTAYVLAMTGLAALAALAILIGSSGSGAPARRGDRS